MLLRHSIHYSMIPLLVEVNTCYQLLNFANATQMNQAKDTLSLPASSGLNVVTAALSMSVSYSAINLALVLVACLGIRFNAHAATGGSPAAQQIMKGMNVAMVSDSMSRSVFLKS